MTIFNALYLISATAGAIAVTFKFRYFRSRWGNPRLWALCLSMLFAVFMFWFSAPANIQLMNRLTGIDNFSAALVYCLNVGFAASTLSLALFWRYPTSQAWPKVRLIVVASVTAITAVAVLFGVSHVPEERLVDFDTYYATQPTVAALVLIFAGYAAIGTGALSYGCFAWARADDYVDRPWLRRGLRLYGVAALCAFTINTERSIAVSASWFGVHAFDTLNSFIVALALPGMLAAAAGVVLPIWGPRWPLLRDRARRWRAFLALRPLHRALSRVDPDVVFVAKGKRLDPYHRVRRQLIELSDWRWMLSNWFDPSIREASRRLGQVAMLPDDQLRATVEAAELKAALDRGPISGDLSPGPARPEEDDDDGARSETDIGGELRRWLHIAHAFRSPIVAAAIAQAPSAGRRDATATTSRPRSTPAQTTPGE